MVESKKMIFMVFLMLFIGCHGIGAQDETPDSSLAEVFSPLDGTWKGIFYIYQLPEGQATKRSIPKDLTMDYFNSLPLKLIDSVRVTQKYTSTTPYYQTVLIEDRYYDDSGKEKIIQSSGINKVEGKSLVCIVNKPDETVIHEGRLPAPNTIVWERMEKSPLKIEYFKETVYQNTYDIIGYGFYGQDNPKQNPQTWFRSSYIKQ